MSNSIGAALQQLDSSNDNHWTADGMPRLDTLKALTGETDITRAQVTEVAPFFSRENPTLETPPEVLNPPSPDAPPVAAAPPVTAPPEEVVAPEPEVAEQPAEPDSVVSTENEDDHIAELQTALAATREGMQEAATAIDAAQQAYNKLVNQEAEIDEELGKLVGVESSGDAIASYLESQKRLVSEKVNRFKQLKESGVLEVVNSLGKMRAPVDVAMSRKRGRGAARPTRAPLK